MKSVSSYYDGVAQDYHNFYDGDLLDPSMPYPANYCRLQLLKESFKNIDKVLDVGCGDGMPLSQLPAKEKYGIDVSPAMVQEAKKRIENVSIADITDPKTYHFLPRDFGGIVAGGVFPHIEDERQALVNIRSLLRVGGKVFIEFRNEIFNLFTFNRLTVDFVVNNLIEDKYKDRVKNELSTRLKMTVPPLRPYDEMLARYHNPVKVVELFEDLKFRNINVLWYHYHPTLPWLDFDRQDALDMEFKPSWKSMFQCSAFVIEAEKC